MSDFFHRRRTDAPDLDQLVNSGEWSVFLTKSRYSPGQSRADARQNGQVGFRGPVKVHGPTHQKLDSLTR